MFTLALDNSDVWVPLLVAAGAVPLLVKHLDGDGQLAALYSALTLLLLPTTKARRNSKNPARADGSPRAAAPQHALQIAAEVTPIEVTAFKQRAVRQLQQLCRSAKLVPEVVNRGGLRAIAQVLLSKNSSITTGALESI